MSKTPAQRARWSLRNVREIFYKLLDIVIEIYYIIFMTSSELKRWLKKQGVTFSTQGKGSHQRAYLNGKVTTFPNHPSKEIPTGTVNAIKRDLGLK